MADYSKYEDKYSKYEDKYSKYEDTGTISPISNEQFEKGKPSALGSVLNKLVQGGSARTIDEISGAANALEYMLANYANSGKNPKEKLQALLDAYRSGKGQVSEQQRLSGEKLGNLAPLVEMAGASSLPIGKAGSIRDMAKAGAKIGGVYGVGGSEADLTRGEILPFLGDVSLGAGLGGIS